jgi:hypothetical protein
MRDGIHHDVGVLLHGRKSHQSRDSCTRAVAIFDPLLPLS